MEESIPGFCRLASPTSYPSSVSGSFPAPERRMTIRCKRKPIPLLLLSLLIIGAAAWWFWNQGSTAEQVRLDQASSRPATTAQALTNSSQREAVEVHIVSVIDASTLPNVVPAGAEGMPIPRRKPLIPRQKPRQQNKQGAQSQFQQGNWPTLDADYSSLGFDSFLDIINRLGGRFFLLVNGSLGPEVSLTDGRILGPRLEPGLAIARPYLVTDEVIQKRLPNSLPSGANRNSVVLLLSSWFDRVLWQELERAVSQQGEKLENIVLIKAAYVKRPSGFYLSMEKVVVRGTGKVLHLNRSIRLPV